MELGASLHLSGKLIHPGLKVPEEEEVTHEHPLCLEHIQVLTAQLKDSELGMGMHVKELPPQLHMAQRGCHGLGMQLLCHPGRCNPVSVKHRW
jgi:hypothetical protein